MRRGRKRLVRSTCSFLCTARYLLQSTAEFFCSRRRLRNTCGQFLGRGTYAFGCLLLANAGAILVPACRCRLFPDRRCRRGSRKLVGSYLRVYTGRFYQCHLTSSLMSLRERCKKLRYCA